MQKIVILEEDIDEDYEPSREDILDYATFLGMSPRSDVKYFHIAKQGLKTPLPHPWKPAQTPDGEVVYFNTETQVVQEDHPMDDHFKRLFIEAKKKDSRNPSKVSKKLQNLCAQLRNDEEGDTTNHLSTEISQKKTSQKQDLSQDQDISEQPKQQYQQQLQQSQSQSQSKSKSQEQSLSLSQSKSQQQSQSQSQSSENYELELVKYEREAYKQFEIYQEKGKQNIEQEIYLLQSKQEDQIDFNIADEALKSRGLYLQEKGKIQSQIEQEFEQKIQQLLKENQDAVKDKMLQFQQTKESLYQSRIQEIENNLIQKINQQKHQVDQQKNLLEVNKNKQKNNIEINLQQLKSSLEKIKQELDKKLKTDQEYQLKLFEKGLEQKKMTIINEIDNAHIKNKNKLAEQYVNDFGYKRKQMLRQMMKEKLELYRLTEEQNIIQNLKEEEYQLKTQMEESLIQYEKQARTQIIDQKIKRLDKEKLRLKQYYENQLAFFKKDVAKKYDLDCKRLDLSKSVNMNESFANYSKSYASETDTSFQSVKSQLTKEIQSYQKKIKDLKVQLLSIQNFLQQTNLIDTLNNQNDKYSFLKQILYEKDAELNQLSQCVIYQPDFTIQIQETPQKVKSNDQWIQQIENEKQWLILQKERLKYDKKQLQKIYEKLNLMSSSIEQVDQYNQSVDSVRQNQQLLQNSEYIIQKLQNNLQEYYKTKIIDYLKQNDILFDDLNKQKAQLDSVPKLPIEDSYFFHSMKVKSHSMHQQETGQGQLQQFLKTQKQMLRDLKDNVKSNQQIQLNKSMMSRMY